MAGLCPNCNVLENINSLILP